MNKHRRGLEREALLGKKTARANAQITWNGAQVHDRDSLVWVGKAGAEVRLGEGLEPMGTAGDPSGKDRQPEIARSGSWEETTTVVAKGFS